MKINAEIIRKFNPCAGRFNNYLKRYENFEGDLKDFVSLENISYNDKVWVVTKLFTKEQNVRWSLLCASSVLSIYETHYPEDKRPRLALEATQNYIHDPSEKNKSAAYAAANAAYAAANANAANAAAYAAANAAAYAAANAAYAAANVNAANAAAYAAANAAYAATNERDIQETTNLLLMVEAE